MLKVIVCLLWAGAAFAQERAVSPYQAFQEFQQDVQKAWRAQVQTLIAQLAASQGRLDFLRSIRNDNDPDVAAAKQKLQELQMQILKAQRVIAIMTESVPSPRMVLPDRWWNNSGTAQYVGLTADQPKKMDDVFQQHRRRLADLSSELEREEILLEPLVRAAPLDEAKITAQIDRVAQARAELEKANGRMLLGIRELLTPDQWGKVSHGLLLLQAPKASAK